MKPHRLLLAALLCTSQLLAAPLAIFSRTDSRTATADAASPAEPAKAAFFTAYVQDLATRHVYPASLPLINPPAWGKTVSPGTDGTVHYLKKFPHGFVCRLQLRQLAPDHPYILTLNGNPEKAGNALLPTPVPGNEREKYYDFLDVRTDARGSYDADLGIFLRPGAYDVRLYVKDAADFKIVLYRDFFPFLVE